MTGTKEHSSPGSRKQFGTTTTGTGRVKGQSGLRYRPIIALGQGGMAEVLLSVGRGPSGFQKLVVLKTMRKELVADPDLREMFLAEARLSARLNHPNVVQVYEVVDTALPCIIMEYLEGQPLSVVMHEAGARLTTPLALRVISEALAGLHYSHELRDYDGTPLDIVHRDVSPQNIFITYDGVVKVLDFGIAKAADAGGNTRTGIVKGKLTYMPREQLLCEQVDRRADIYAVGGMLWQVASGVKPWHDTPEGEVMRALIEGGIPKPSEYRPVDPKLEAIVMKALAPNAEDRYATAQELRQAIDQYLAETYSTSNIHEVGELVSSLFSEQREARKKEIHTALSAAGSSEPPPIPEGLEAIVAVEVASRIDAIGLARERKIVRILSVTVGVAVITVGGAIAVIASRNDSSKKDIPAVGSATAPDQIQLRLVATPLAATFSIDGKPVVGNPSAMLVAPDTNDHEIRATLDGYEPVTKRVRFERDLSLEISLQPTPWQPTAGPATSSAAAQAEPSNHITKDSGGTPKPHRLPASGSKKTSADCALPFYYENGIKVYKPGCI